MQPSGYLDLQHGSNVKKNVMVKGRVEGEDQLGFGALMLVLTVAVKVHDQKPR